MSEMIAHIPDIFWIFAGISLIVLASGYAKNMGKGPGSEDLKHIKQRLDRIEHHLDLRD